MESRTKKSFRNISFGVIGLLANLVVTFVAKSIFIRLLGAEYNGVNGLFTNILNVLNLAELGFSASVGYALYRPLKEGDEETTARLMNYIAKVYRIIAIVVAAAGCCCIPALQYLIAEDISTLPFTLSQLRIYFAMFLANTVCSYLLAYKRTLISADQNSYIITNTDNICNIVLNVVQIVLLLIFKNYYAYLVVLILKTVINNIILHIIAGKKYPYLRKYRKLQPEKTEKSSIFKNVQAMFLNKIGIVVLYSTTSLIISAFVSLVDAGKYSNYLMITSNIYSFINLIFNSMTASVGNLCVEGDVEYQYKVFRKVQYLADFFAVFCFVCYLCLFNDFITIWVGESMLFSLPVVIVISLNAMILYIRRATIAFRDAQAFYKKDWYKPIIESVGGVGLAIGLSYVLGTLGVILGFTLVMFFVSFIIENHTLFKYGFKKRFFRQIAETVGVMIFACGVGALTYYIGTFIPVGVGWFVLKLIFCMVISSGCFFLVSFRTPEFKYYVTLTKNYFKRIVAKIKNRTKKPCPETANSGAMPNSDISNNPSSGNSVKATENLFEDVSVGEGSTDSEVKPCGVTKENPLDLMSKEEENNNIIGNDKCHSLSELSEDKVAVKEPKTDKRSSSDNEQYAPKSEDTYLGAKNKKDGDK